MELKPMPGDRVCSYIRASTTKQANSLERQDIAEQVQRDFGCQVGKVFTDPGGKRSGENRLDFGKMRAEIAQGCWDWVIVAEQDRYGSDHSFEWGEFCVFLLQHKCNLYSMKDRRCLTDPDDAAAVVTGSVNSLVSRIEQTNKSKRLIETKHRLAEAGRWNGGNIPYGFDVAIFNDKKEAWRIVLINCRLGKKERLPNGREVHPRTYDCLKVFPDGRKERFRVFPARNKDDEPRLVPSNDPQRLQTLQTIFSLYQQSHSMTAIARHLNQLNIKPMYGKHWTEAGIRTLLVNPIYQGIHAYGKESRSRYYDIQDGASIPVRHFAKTRPKRFRPEKDQVRHQIAALVDPNLFAQVQGIRGQVRSYAPRQDKLWLQPFLVCGRCGGNLRAENTEDCYFCGTNQTERCHGLPLTCQRNKLEHALVESYLVRYLTDMGADTEAILHPQPPAIQPLEPEAQERVKRLQAILARIHAFTRTYLDPAAAAEWGNDWVDASELDLCAFAFNHMHRQWTEQLEAKEQEMERMLDQFLLLGKNKVAIDRANARMAEIEKDINDLKGKLAPLVDEHDRLHAEIERMHDAADTMRQYLSSENNRAKTSRLRDVVEKIVCHFTDTEAAKKKRCGQARKSVLTRIEVVGASHYSKMVYDLTEVRQDADASHDGTAKLTGVRRDADAAHSGTSVPQPAKKSDGK